MCLLLWLNHFLEIFEKSSRALCCGGQPKRTAKLTIRAMGKSGRACFDGHPHGCRIQDFTMPHVLYNYLDLLKQSSKNTHIPYRFGLSMGEVFDKTLKNPAVLHVVGNFNHGRHQRTKAWQENQDFPTMIFPATCMGKKMGVSQLAMFDYRWAIHIHFPFVAANMS